MVWQIEARYSRRNRRLAVEVRHRKSGRLTERNRMEKDPSRQAGTPVRGRICPERCRGSVAVRRLLLVILLVAPVMGCSAGASGDGFAEAKRDHDEQRTYDD
jgi:hypothetical protein